MKDHERANRDLWDRQSDEYQAGHGVPISAAPDACGSWRIPESELHLLPHVRGLDVLELGCGGGQWTAWLAEQGANVTGFDISEKQLEPAHNLLSRKGVRARLVAGSAEILPFEAQTFDLIISDHGAMSWADPARTVPEAARVLRPGGHLIFCATSVLLLLVGWDENAGPSNRLERDYFGLAAISEGVGGAQTFWRPHGELDQVVSREWTRGRRPHRTETRVGCCDHLLSSRDGGVGPALASGDDLGGQARTMSHDDAGLKQLQRQFAYHSWATLKLIDFCRSLDRTQLVLTADGTLGSIERTLTHLVSSEQFYLRDLTGADPPTWIESRIVSLDELCRPFGRERITLGCLPQLWSRSRRSVRDHVARQAEGCRSMGISHPGHRSRRRASDPCLHGLGRERARATRPVSRSLRR